MRRVHHAAVLVLLALAALCALTPSVALATPSKDGCAIIPFDPAQPTIGIYGPNTWCLDRDIVVTQDDSVISLITVHMSDTTIDCRGHLLEYQGTADFSYGVATADAAERVTVRNCRFRGFSFAIDLGDGDGNVIEDNIVHSSRAGYFGQATTISAYGTATIRRNRVSDSISRAIVAGEDSTVTDNVVDGVSDSPDDSNIIGIDLYGGGVEIARNTIRNLHHQGTSGTDQIHAVQLSDGGVNGRREEIADNVFVQQGGDEFNNAIYCAAMGARIADNVFTGYALPTNCAGFDAAANDVSP
jgi:hypothetical protein